MSPTQVIVYNIFPLLAGPFRRWKEHFSRAAALGFDWVFVNGIVKTLAVCSDAAMSQPAIRPPLYRGYRFPAEIISRCVWLYYRFGVSLRDVSELMLARGIEVSHETIRLWTLRFGTEYARRLRRTRGPCSNIWHLDELCLVINGQRGWLWRAVDDAGEVLDILVQRRRNALAAKRFFRKLLKGLRMVRAPS